MRIMRMRTKQIAHSGIKRSRQQSGQTLTEFMVIAVMMMGMVATLFALLAVFTEYGWRILSLVGLEYP